MNNFCFNVNFNIRPFKDGFEPFSLKELYHYHLDMDEFIHQELIDFLGDHGVKAGGLSTFYCKPYHDSIIHTDQGAEHYDWNYAKINFVFGGKDSVMNWFKPITQPKVTTDQLGASSYFNRWSRSEVELIHQEWIGFPGICQVGIPHNVTTKSEKRRCMSLHIGKLNSNKRLSYQEAIDIFKNFSV